MREQITVRDVRNNNKINFIKTLLSNGELSRNEIAQKNNISIMTVKNIVDDLLEKNIVCERKTDTSLVGRKPSVLSIADDIGVIALLDLTSKNMLYYGIYNVYREKIRSGFYRYNSSKSYEENLRTFFAQINSDMEQMDLQKLLGMGIIVPGVYFADEDRVYNELIREMNEVRLNKLSQEFFGVNNIVIEHDVKMAAIAEGIGDQNGAVDDLYLLFLGEGVGGALILNGQIYDGHNGVAGDLGQVLVDCSREGEVTLESVLSQASIISRIKKQFKKEGINLGRNADELDFADIINLYKGGDKIVVNYFKEIFSMLARVVYNIIWMVNPSPIIIGSNDYDFALISAQLLTEYVNKLVQARAVAVDCEIKVSKYKENSALIGIFEEVLNRCIEKM